MTDKLFTSDLQLRKSWRRVAVIVLATVLLILGHLPPEWWGALALVYIVGDAAERALVRRLGGPSVAPVIAPPSRPGAP